MGCAWGVYNRGGLGGALPGNPTAIPPCHGLGPGMCNVHTHLWYEEVGYRVLAMNVSISLTPELADLIRAKVASGRYSSPSEVVCEALRLLERADQCDAEELRRLREAWKEGMASGDAGPLDFA